MRRLLAGQEQLGWFEIKTEREHRGRFVRHDRVALAIGTNHRYFSPLPRFRLSSLKDDVASDGNVVWVDIDSRDALVGVPILAGLGIAPSAVIDSGGGFWFYWKLAELISTDEIVAWNKRLTAFLHDRIPGVDPISTNKNRLARLPGTVHEDTGITAHFVAEHCPWSVHTPEDFERVLPVVVPEPAVPALSIPPASVADWPDEVGEVIARFWWYLGGGVTKEELHARGQTRHEIEFAFAVALRDAGCSREQALAVFEQYQPRKHAEKTQKVPGNSLGYARLTIEKAFQTPQRDPRPTAKKRAKRAYRSPDRGEVLLMVYEQEGVGEPYTVGGLVDAIVDRWGCTSKTAENTITQLVNAKELSKERVGRQKLVRTTEKARGLLAQTSGPQKGLHLLPPIHATEGSSGSRMIRRPLPSRPPAEEKGSAVEARPQTVGETGPPTNPSCVSIGEHFGYQSPQIARHAPPGTTDSQLATILKRNWIDDWYRISFEGPSPIRYIQFTTDWDAIYDHMLFYDQLLVAHDLYPAEDLTDWAGVPIYRSFISQTQPGVEDPDEDLILAGRWKNPKGDWQKVKPYPYGLGLAVELTASLTPATHTIIASNGDVVTRPNYGLVVMPQWTFWRSLRRYCREHGVHHLTDHVLKVTRSGRKYAHNFSFEITAPAVNWSPPPNDTIDLLTVLNELVNEKRLHTYVSPLPQGWCFRG